MKSHEKKMHDKAEHEKELERNDLYEWLKRTWARLKAGEIVSRKFALIALGVGAVIGLGIYFLTRTGSNSEAWQKLDSARFDDLENLAKNEPESTPAKIARLQLARHLLGPRGVNQWNGSAAAIRDAKTRIEDSKKLEDAKVRQADVEKAEGDMRTAAKNREEALKNMLQAREMFGKLVEDFKNDLTMKCEALAGAAQAELCLVGVPIDGKPAGSVDKAIELYRQYEKTAGPKAGEPAKKIAEELESRKGDVERLSEYIAQKQAQQ